MSTNAYQNSSDINNSKIELPNAHDLMFECLTRAILAANNKGSTSIEVAGEIPFAVQQKLTRKNFDVCAHLASNDVVTTTTIRWGLRIL